MKIILEIKASENCVISEDVVDNVCEVIVGAGETKLLRVDTEDVKNSKSKFEYSMKFK